MAVTHTYDDEVVRLADARELYNDLRGRTDQLSEQKADNILKTISTPAAMQTFDDGADNLPVKQMVIGIEPVQAGTGDPSPENVRAISGWTGCNVTAIGQNLLNPSKWTQGYIRANTGAISVRTRSVTNTEYIPIKKNGYYHLKFAGDGFLNLIALYDKNFNYIVFDASYLTVIQLDGYKKCTFTINNQDAEYMRICYDVPSDSTIDPSDELTSPSFMAECEAGTTNMDFVPFAGAIYPITFPSAAGTVYGGTLTVNEDGTGTLAVNCKKIILGQVAGHIYSGVYLIDPTSDCADFAYDEVDPLLKSDRFKTFENKGITDFSRNAPDFSICGRNTNNNNMKLMLKDTRYTTAEAFVAAHGDAEIIYPLREPVSYTLAAPQVKTLLGLNNIWADTGNVNSITYRTDENINYEINRISGRVDDTQDMIAPAETLTATSNHAIDDIFVCGDQLLRATAAIATGEAINTGTGGNAGVVTVAELIAALAARVTTLEGGVILKAWCSENAGVGDEATFYVESQNMVSWQWQWYNGGWVNIPSEADGETTPVMKVVFTDASIKRKWRCVMVDRLGETHYVQGFNVPGLAEVSKPADVTASIGDTLTFSVVATNADSYHWQVHKNGWKDIETLTEYTSAGLTGYDTDTVSFTLTSNTANNVRCVVTGVKGETVSAGGATITIAT